MKHSIFPFVSLLGIAALTTACGGGTGQAPMEPAEEAAPTEIVLAVMAISGGGSGSGGSPQTSCIARIGRSLGEGDSSTFDVTPPLTGDEDGESFVLRLDAGADPEFVLLAEVLTNGIDDFIVGGTGTSSGGGFTSGYLESRDLVGQGAWRQGPDLASATITHIETHVLRVSFSPGTSYSYSLDVIVLIWGVV